MALDYCRVVCTCPMIPVMNVIILTYITPYSMPYFDSNLCNNVDHISIGGDFNTDLSPTQSAHAMSLNHKTFPDFLLIINMRISQFVCRSCIDYFVI